jgi:hypothetical protein
MTKAQRPVKMGRPRLEDQAKSLKALKPWAKLNMSRATWYRRQREQQKSKEMKAIGDP